MKTATRTEIWSWNYSGIRCQIFPQSNPVEGLIRVHPLHPWAGCRPEDIQVEFAGEIVSCWPAMTDWVIQVSFPGLSAEDAAIEIEVLAEACLRAGGAA